MRKLREIDNVLKELKTSLVTLYGDRIKKFIIYGSWARQEASEDSDIDVAIVLSGNVIPGREIDRVNDLLSEINLKYDVLISIYPVSEKSFDEIKSPILINIKKEGIAA